MNSLKKIYHVLIKRDVASCFFTHGFKYFGKKTTIYKTRYIRNKKNIEIGDNTTILNNARMQVFNDLTGLNSCIKIGKNCFIGYNNSFLAGEDIIIEDGVLLASNILITSENHGNNPEDLKYYSQQKLICKPVCIKEGAWIGEKCSILSGVTIGKKCIIGANSVVTKSIPDFCIAVGSPAKVIKIYNFEEHAWKNVE